MADDAFEDMRVDYGDAPLRRADLPDEPLSLLQRWLDEAAAAEVREPNGMAVATCGADGQPQCRVVLLKKLDGRGLSFFTNRDSDKGQQLRQNARAAATFWWVAPRARQVRVTGTVVEADAADSDRYFHSRPRRAQICSAASPQSRVVADRAELERLVDAFEAGVGEGEVPRPPHWGGYVLQPEVIEFWQGRTARLHDRFRFTRDGGAWRLERLAP